MEHVKYLKKVAAAKKHQAEYERTGTQVYPWIMLLGVIGALLLPIASYPLAPYVILLVALIAGSLSALKKHLNEKKFKEEFKKEADYIAEHEELLKGK